jgi:16S rRNA (cytidine1402-2'-O)-methyltransferase
MEETRQLMESPPTLHLIPNTLGSRSPHLDLSASAVNAVEQCNRFIVESQASWGRLMNDINPDRSIREMEYFLLNEHTDEQDLLDLMRWFRGSTDIGLVSDAGCPGVADPGAQAVRMAHTAGWIVKPHIGPSSILLALMASGMNGQAFAFKGYLPRAGQHRDQRWKEMREGLQRRRETQIFMEPPYRNDAAFMECLERLSPDQLLCVAVDLTLPGEWIKSLAIEDWKEEIQRNGLPALNKRPCLFLIG